MGKFKRRIDCFMSIPVGKHISPFFFHMDAFAKYSLVFVDVLICYILETREQALLLKQVQLSVFFLPSSLLYLQWV